MCSLHPAAEMCGSGFDRRKGNWCVTEGGLRVFAWRNCFVERTRGSNTAIQKRSIRTSCSAIYHLSCMSEKLKLKNRQQDEY